MNVNAIFFESCENGNLEKVKACVTLGFNVNSVSPDGKETGLGIAAGKDNLELLEYLLSCSGVDVNKVTGCYTPLMKACYAGNDRIVRRLSQVPGIEVNYQTSSGMSAAHWAALNGRTECVRTLSTVEEVDWNLKDGYGTTPHPLALVDNHAECAEIIVSINGVDLAATDRSGWTLAHRAAQGGVDSVQVLLGLDGIRWNEKNDNGDSPVMVAFKYEKYDAVKLLITDVNVDTEIRNIEGNTLEDLARQEGTTDILEFLPSRTHRRVKELEEKLRRANLQMQRNIPECPVSSKCFQN